MSHHRSPVSLQRQIGEADDQIPVLPSRAGPLPRRRGRRRRQVDARVRRPPLAPATGRWAGAALSSACRSSARFDAISVAEPGAEMSPIATSSVLMGKRPGCADGSDLPASWCECRITARREARGAVRRPGRIAAFERRVRRGQQRRLGSSSGRLSMNLSSHNQRSESQASAEAVEQPGAERVRALERRALDRVRLGRGERAEHREEHLIDVPWREPDR